MVGDVAANGGSVDLFIFPGEMKFADEEAEGELLQGDFARIIFRQKRMDLLQLFGNGVLSLTKRLIFHKAVSYEIRDAFIRKNFCQRVFVFVAQIELVESLREREEAAGTEEKGVSPRQVGFVEISGLRPVEMNPFEAPGMVCAALVRVGPGTVNPDTVSCGDCVAGAVIQKKSFAFQNYEKEKGIQILASADVRLQALKGAGFLDIEIMVSRVKGGRCQNSVGGGFCHKNSFLL